jgi:hypothetical protein
VILQNLFDRLNIRIFIGVTLGLPISALAVIGGLYGLFIGFGGFLTTGKAMFALITAITLLGLAGIFGAWRRILRSSLELTEPESKTIRTLLGAGVLSSVSLADILVYFSESFWLILAFIILGVIGILLILATPSQTPSSKRDA